METKTASFALPSGSDMTSLMVSTLVSFGSLTVFTNSITLGVFGVGCHVTGVWLEPRTCNTCNVTLNLLSSTLPVVSSRNCMERESVEIIFFG
jgi:hypothetical protein